MPRSGIHATVFPLNLASVLLCSFHLFFFLICSLQHFSSFKSLVFLTFSLHLASYFSVTFPSFPISNDNTRLKRQLYSQPFRAYLSHFQRQAQCWGQRNQTGTVPWIHLPSVQTHHFGDQVLWASMWQQGLTVGSSKSGCHFCEANIKQNYRTQTTSLLQWHSET